ncbi:hypothetical protein LguiA_006632 [Lonicera macranthoides]
MMNRTLNSINSGTHLSSFLSNRSGRQIVKIDVFFGNRIGEIKAGGRTSEVKDGGVVGTSCGDGGRVRAKPYTRPLVWFPDFGNPLSPLPHPNPSVGFVLLPVMLLPNFLSFHRS